MLVINFEQIGTDDKQQPMFFISSFVMPNGEKVERDPKAIEIPDFTKMLGYHGPARIVEWVGGSPVNINYGMIRCRDKNNFDFMEGGVYGPM